MFCSFVPCMSSFPPYPSASVSMLPRSPTHSFPPPALTFPFTGSSSLSMCTLEMVVLSLRVLGGVRVHCHHSASETEAGPSRVQGYAGLQRESLFQNLNSERMCPAARFTSAAQPRWTNELCLHTKVYSVIKRTHTTYWFILPSE